MWVTARKAEGFPTTTSCDVAGVSRQAFYDWRQQQATEPSKAQRVEAELVAQIRQIHAESHATYGSPRVCAVLRRRRRCVNRERVERLMRVHGIVGIHKRRRRRCANSAGVRPAPKDKIRRGFAAGRPDAVWVGDITYIPTGEGWLHLATVLDLGSRRLIGYSMAAHTRTELVIDALDMAAAARSGRTSGIVFLRPRDAIPIR